MRIYRIENQTGSGPYTVFAHGHINAIRAMAMRKGFDVRITLDAWCRAQMIAHSAVHPFDDIREFSGLRLMGAHRGFIYGCKSEEQIVQFFKPTTLLYLALYHPRYMLAEYESDAFFEGKSQVMFVRATAKKLGRRRKLLPALEKYFSAVSSSVELQP